MQLSQTEFKVLEQVADGNNRVETIAQNLHRSNSQIYRAQKILSEQGFLHLDNGYLKPEKSTYSSLLLILLSRFPLICTPSFLCQNRSPYLNEKSY